MYLISSLCSSYFARPVNVCVQSASVVSCPATTFSDTTVSLFFNTYLIETGLFLFALFESFHVLLTFTLILSVDCVNVLVIVFPTIDFV